MSNSIQFKREPMRIAKIVLGLVLIGIAFYPLVYVAYEGVSSESSGSFCSELAGWCLVICSWVTCFTGTGLILKGLTGGFEKRGDNV